MRVIITALFTHSNNTLLYSTDGYNADEAAQQKRFLTGNPVSLDEILLQEF